MCVCMYVCIYACMHACMHLTIVNLIFVIAFLNMTACPAGTFNEGRGFNCSGTCIFFLFIYFACLLVARMEMFLHKMEQEREIYSAARVIVKT